jgi:hypothetical protein
MFSLALSFLLALLSYCLLVCIFMAVSCYAFFYGFVRLLCSSLLTELVIIMIAMGIGISRPIDLLSGILF